jgi:hypothetical protein
LALAAANAAEFDRSHLTSSVEQRSMLEAVLSFCGAEARKAPHPTQKK